MRSWRSRRGWLWLWSCRYCLADCFSMGRKPKTDLRVPWRLGRRRGPATVTAWRRLWQESPEEALALCDKIIQTCPIPDRLLKRLGATTGRELYEPLHDPLRRDNESGR